MNHNARGSTVRRIDYSSAFGFTDIFRSFKIATQPDKLAMALLLVVVMFVVGWVVDGLFGRDAVAPGEFDAFVAAGDEAQFEQWAEAYQGDVEQQLYALLIKAGADSDRANEVLDRADSIGRAHTLIADQYAKRIEQAEEGYADAGAREAAVEQLRQRRDQALADVRSLEPRGVFAEALSIKIDAFDRLIAAVLGTAGNLDWSRIGIEQVNPGVRADPDTVVGALRVAGYAMPRWVWSQHPWVLVIWLIVFIAAWSLLGGALARLSVVEAATGERLTMSDGVSFAARRWLSFALMPLVPLIFLGLFALALSLFGLLFHVWVLDIIAALLWGAAIVVGLLLALGLIGWVASVHMMYPALAAESSDLFDGVSRSYSYVVARPWRFAWYTIVALVYGALTYFFIGLVIFLTLLAARAATGAWVAPFEQMLPRPQIGQLVFQIQTEGLGPTERIAAVILKVWVMLTIGLVAAYAISYYLASYSIIYLLLRRECDGTDTSQIAADQPATSDESPPAAPAKTEPPGDPVDKPDDQ
jgi:hypothetical protein